MNKERTATSDVLQGVVENNKSDEISFSDLKTSFHERGFGLLMVIFSLPVTLPMPPGIASIPGIPLFMFAVQMIMGMDSPWLPKFIGNKKIKRSTLAYVVEKTAPYLKKVEKLLKPRLSFASSPMGERVIGIFAMLCSLSILLPLPMGNFVPALGILIMSLGMLSKDGVTIIVGMVVGTIGLFIAAMVLIVGQKAVLGVINRLFG